MFCQETRNANSMAVVNTVNVHKCEFCVRKHIAVNVEYYSFFSFHEFIETET